MIVCLCPLKKGSEHESTGRKWFADAEAAMPFLAILLTANERHIAQTVL
jgi:hypothetical protein